MNNPYYDALFDPSHPARSAGWRHELEQAFRFELACACLPMSACPSVLDVGCGPGGLPAYRARAHPSAQWEYTGIDRYAPSIDAARERCPGQRFVVGEVEDLAHASYDMVVGIGTMVDGQTRDHRARLRRLLAHVRAMLRVSSQRVCVIVLKSEAMAASVALSSEPALAGASKAELEDLMRHLCPEGAWSWRVFDAGAQDWGLVVDKKAQVAVPVDAVARACERALASPWGARAPAWRHAWLYWAAGLYDVARDVMSRVDTDEPAAHVLRARLEVG